MATDPYRKLTKDESALRSRADTREFKQRCIDTIVDLKISYARLLALLSKNKLPDTDRYPISSDPIRHQWAELETLLLYAIPENVPQKINTPLPFSQLPITGDIPEIMNDVTQGQPSKQTTIYQDDDKKITHIRQKLVQRCQEEIRKHYQQQFTFLHPGEKFFEDPLCMPQKIKMSLLSKMALEPLERGGFFPGTGVDNVVGILVEADSSLGDRIICE